MDFILLSFFDGVASAGLICNQVLSTKKFTWKGFAWETDNDLVSLSKQRFPEIQHRGDLDHDDPASVIHALRAIDPESRAVVIIAAGPPCPDHSRIRATAPGVHGCEGSQVSSLCGFLAEAGSVMGLLTTHPCCRERSAKQQERCQALRAKAVSPGSRVRLCRLGGDIASAHLVDSIAVARAQQQEGHAGDIALEHISRNSQSHLWCSPLTT